MKTIVTTPIFNVSVKEVGDIKEFATVHHPGAVAILAHDEDFVYLTRQYRPAVERNVLELPAGTCEKDETPRETARREIEEEIGKRAGNLDLLTTFYSSPGFTDELVWMFEATNLTDEIRPFADDNDAIEIVPWSLNELDKAISEANTAKTIVGLLLLKDRL